MRENDLRFLDADILLHLLGELGGVRRLR